MIEVTRLNQSILLINPDLIATVEATPDTVITLTTGEKYIVREAPQELVERFITFKRAIYQNGFTILPTQPVS